MKRKLQRMGLVLGVWAVTGWLGTQALAQHIRLLDFTGVPLVPRLTVQSDIGITNQIQYTNNLGSSNWAVLATVVVTQTPYTYLHFSAPPAPQRFYRVVDPNLPPTPAGMVWIRAGTFTMGSPDSESNEGPQTQVTISRSFCIGKYEVRQGEYLAVIGTNPSYFTGDMNRPVEQVSWDDATNYCAMLTAREAGAGRLLAGYVYRLPTEAEWEYACRAGTTTAFHYGNELRSGMANFDGRYEYLLGDPNHNNPDGIHLNQTTSVGSYAPNAWGLYDMHGNVWEWCQDWYSTSLPGGSVTDPQGPGSGLSRVIRGGSWLDDANYCRSAHRLSNYPSPRYSSYGFRVVLAPVAP